MSMSIKMKMQMASMMGKSVMKNVLRDFGRDRKLVLCLSVRSLSIAINEYDDIRHTHDDVTVRIRWIGRYLTSTISKIKRFE